jgi:hypothetical protein
VDITFLSILSALTSGPPVIQQPVKALHLLSSFGPSVTEVSQHIHFGTLLMGSMMAVVALFKSPFHGKDPDQLAMVNVALLFLLLLGFMFGMLGIWLFRLAVGFCHSSLDFLLRSLRLLGLSREPPQFNSNV